MKRGKPLNRGAGLERRTELRPDPEKVREFLRRSRQGLERSSLNRRPRQRPVEGPLSPAEWRRRAFDASGGRCIVSGARTDDVDDPRFHAHHPLAKRELRARRLWAHVWDPRNALWLRRDVHIRHEDAFEPVPHTLLPVSVWEFCREMDALEGSEWATLLVLRAHPVRAVPGISQQEVGSGEGCGDWH